MRYDYDCKLLAKFVQQFLYFSGGNRIKCARRLVHQQNLRIYGKSARNAKTLLLSAAHSKSAFVQPVFYFVPDCRTAQGFFYNFIKFAFFLKSVSTRSVCNVVINTHRKRIRFLEHHSDAFSKDINVNIFKQIFSVKKNFTFYAASFYKIIHPVQAF